MTSNASLADAASDYREFLPAAALREHFLCFWSQTVSSSGPPCRHRVLPDACIDIVLIDDRPPVVVGPWTKSFIAHLAPGSLVVGARFHPGRAGALLSLPVSELLDLSVPLSDISKNDFVDYLSPVAEAPDSARKLRALQSAALRCLSRSRPLDRVVGVAIESIAQQPRARIAQISSMLGMSSRQLQRRFCAAVGYGPKMFQSVLRFQRLLHLADTSGVQRDFAQSASEAGYADQPHMTREVQRFSGTAPSSLLGSASCTLQMSDLFKTPTSV
jgi:AraC-like DNA-binding protein